MTATAQHLPTPDAQALAHLAASGALGHGIGDLLWVEDTWLHTDLTCADLDTPSPVIDGPSLARALRGGDLQLCACSFPASRTRRSALLTLAEAVHKADRALAGLDAGGRWDQQLGRVTQVQRQRDIADTLLLEHAVTGPLARWTAAAVRRYDDRLQATAAVLIPQIRTALPAHLTETAGRRNTPTPAASGPRVVACAQSPFGDGQQTTVQRAVAYAWPTTSRGSRFYAQVPGGVPWSARGELVDCGAQNDTDTTDVLDVALQLQAAVTQGSVYDPAGALSAARLLVGTSPECGR